MKYWWCWKKKKKIKLLVNGWLTYHTIKSTSGFQGISESQHCRLDLSTVTFWFAVFVFAVFQEMMNRWFFMMWRGGYNNTLMLIIKASEQLDILTAVIKKAFGCPVIKLLSCVLKLTVWWLCTQERNSERVPAHRRRVQFVRQSSQRQRVRQLIRRRTRSDLGHPRAAKHR